jgi:hypothetical protein
MRVKLSGRLRIPSGKNRRRYICVSEIQNLNLTLLFDINSMHYCRRSCPVVSRPQKPHSMAPNYEGRLVNTVKLGRVVVLTMVLLVTETRNAKQHKTRSRAQLLLRDLKLKCSRKSELSKSWIVSQKDWSPVYCLSKTVRMPMLHFCTLIIEDRHVIPRVLVLRS